MVSLLLGLITVAGITCTMTAVMWVTASDNGYLENDNELLWKITAYIFVVVIGVFPLMYLTSAKSKKPTKQ